MREYVDDCVDLFDRPFRRAWRVADDHAAADAGNTSRQSSVTADEAHCFGQAWSVALDDRSGAFRCLIAGREAGTAGGDDEPGKAMAHFGQRRRNSFRAIFGDAVIDHHETVGSEVGCESATPGVVPRPVEHAIADGQHFRQQYSLVVRRFGRHVERRYRISTMPSVSASCGRTRHPWPNGRHRPTCGGSGSISKPSGVG